MKKPAPVRTEVLILEGHQVAIEVYRNRGWGGKYRGCWECLSLSFCRGASSGCDDGIEEVITLNRINAALGVSARIKELERNAANE